MFAWTGHVTQGKLGTSVAISPPDNARDKFGIDARSPDRRPGIESSTTCLAVMPHHYPQTVRRRISLVLALSEAVLVLAIDRESQDQDSASAVLKCKWGPGCFVSSTSTSTNSPRQRGGSSVTVSSIS